MSTLDVVVLLSEMVVSVLLDGLTTEFTFVVSVVVVDTAIDVEGVEIAFVDPGRLLLTLWDGCNSGSGVLVGIGGLPGVYETFVLSGKTRWLVLGSKVVVPSPSMYIHTPSSLF